MERDERRQLIMDSAIALFVEKGVEQTKIVDISKKAEIGKSTFYEYFKNKADLVCQWLAEKMASVQVSEEMLANLPDQSAKITLLLRESCNPELASREMMAMFVEFWRLAINERHPQAQEMMKSMYAVYSDLLCGWLREGVASGEFVEHDEEKVAAGLIGGIDGLWLQFLVFGDSYRLDENVETYVATLLTGLRPGRSQ
ncbi:MAG: TetR family transcriptional regulator [Desulfuromonadaceae bacterium]|nr:TetR family transcriptional regulator [Desulfuromonadaceae bacterium]